MPSGDFFAFCTTLKPLELKALGELSRVRHLDAGETIYSPGEKAEALFIINRGTVELVAEGEENSTVNGYLARGEVFGDLEVLAGLPRGQLAHAHEAVSLQVIPAEIFPGLVQRVPGFFRFLSEHLAHRLMQVRKRAPERTGTLELSGSLANFDLVTIYQTIVSSLQTGELAIVSHGEPVSAFYFEEGRPRCGQFQHLTGEEAFWQLFLSTEVPGTFTFSSGERSIGEWIQAGGITRHPADMLISALQFRDEFEALRGRLPDREAELRRNKLNLDWPLSAPHELRAIAIQIWQIAYSSPVTLAALYNRCSVCELKIHRVVDELLRSNHFLVASPLSVVKIA